MPREFAKFGDKVKFFSNTAGAGLTGVSQRVRGWLKHDPAELFNIAYRKSRKAVSPKSMPFAQAVHIEVTNACNLKCIMCPRLEMTRPVGFMDRALFEKIIAQLAPHKRLLKGVALMGLGEPLMHKELEDFSVIAENAGLPNLYTSTNAALLFEQRAKSILEIGKFDRIIFSVDGITRETFEQIRKGAKFADVYANIERFLEIKNHRGAKPAATLQILVMSETKDELLSFCEYWVPKLGPRDDILIKEVDTFGGLVEDRRLEKNVEPQNRFACRQLWHDLSIAWDGSVTVCCKDVFYKLAVGSANETPLGDLWKGKKWDALRKAHQKGVYTMDPCAECKEWYL